MSEEEKIEEPKVEQGEGEISQVTFWITYPAHDDKDIDLAQAKCDVKLVRAAADWMEKNPERPVDTILFQRAEDSSIQETEALLSLLLLE
jgi:hypothetical protein